MNFINNIISEKIYKAVKFLILVVSVWIFVVPLAADTPKASEVFDQYVAKYAKPKRVKFTDDHTNVAGKAYDLAKATAGWFGVPGSLFDTAEFADTVRKEGLTSGNVLSITAKIIADNIDIKIVSKQIKGMNKSEILTILKEENLFDLDVLALQRRLLDYVTETATKAASSTLDGKGKVALENVLIDIVTKVCKSCDVAHKSYEFAKESAKAAELAFDNELTQAMFEHMDKRIQVDEYRDFIGEFVKNKNFTDEARKALALYHKSTNRPPPTNEEVMHYVFNRYKRWQREKKILNSEAEILIEAKGMFLALKKFEIAQFGDNYPEQISNALKRFLAIYKKLMKYKGDKYMPPGGRMSVIRSAMYLLKNSDRNVLDYRKLFTQQLQLLHWKKKPQELSEIEKKNRSTHVRERLIRLNDKKLQLVFNYMGIKPPKSFYHCLCRSAGYGSPQTRQFYHPGTIGDFDERYTCQHPGEPCVVSGFGCSRYPLPKKENVWNDCMNTNRIGMKKDKNGRVIMQKDKNGKVVLDNKGNPIPTGRRIDEYISTELQKGH